MQMTTSVLLPAALLATLFLLGCSAEPRYLWGDALRDSLDSIGPDGQPYPRALIEELYKSGGFGGSRHTLGRGRALFGATLDPVTVSNLLLGTQQHGGVLPEHLPLEGRSFSRESRSRSLRSRSRSAARNLIAGDVNADIKIIADDDEMTSQNATQRQSGASFSTASESCPSGTAPPAQLCPTKYNTTAPMWGRSLTSGQRVTIVQKFPDLLQQVIFHECTSQNCDIIHGRCTQTFTPYLFLVIPLGPVTLTGQDYVMVESGCACQPKYSSGTPYATPLDAFNG